MKSGLKLVVALVLFIGVPFSVIGGGCWPFGARDWEEDDLCGQPSQVLLSADASVDGFSHEQLQNAAAIVKAGAQLGMSTRDQIIGVATAIAESSLKVIDYGDAVGPDSRGLFQQRDNGAWGSYSDRMDPIISATNFFKALKAISNRDSLEPTIAAHRVQRNADPYVYAKHMGAAAAIVAEVTGKTSAVSLSAQSSTSAKTYDLGAVQPITSAAANTIGPMFGIKTIYGFRSGAGAQDHGLGLAADFMINDIDNGTSVGQRLADQVVENAKDYGVSYVIWQQKIWLADNPDAGWRVMEDRGSPTQNHMDHVHVSFKADATFNGSAGSTVECVAPSAGGTSRGAIDGWALPGEGVITSPYGPRWGGVHEGIDLASGCDKPIWAARAGRVTRTGFDNFGNGVVAIDHGDGIVTRYLHMYEPSKMVHVGQQVQAGQQIAVEGSSGNSTGCHLHFEVLIDGQHTDPLPYMAQRGIKLGG